MIRGAINFILFIVVIAGSFLLTKEAKADTGTCCVDMTNTCVIGEYVQHGAYYSSGSCDQSG